MVWNSILAGIVYQHQSIEQLRRELSRNAQLCWLCGFDLLRGQAAVPVSSVYSRFLGLLMTHTELINKMFDDLVEQLREILPGFGRILAMDGKVIRPKTFARRRKGLAGMSADGRRDIDANVGKKTCRGVRQDGTLWKLSLIHI